MAHATLPVAFKSRLNQMARTTPTCLWNDSASIDELTRSVEDGAVGATCWRRAGICGVARGRELIRER